MDKETFISNYLTKHMKNVNEKLHGQYLKILANTEEQAEIAWLKFKTKQNGK